MRLTPSLLKHAEALLAELLRTNFAADSVVSRYFRQHAGLGHADRGFIAESVYAVLRRRRSVWTCLIGSTKCSWRSTGPRRPKKSPPA